MNPRQHVLVGVANLLEQRRGGLRRGRGVVDGGVEAQVVLDHVGDGLGVGCGAGAAAPDGVMDLCELVRHAVGDVGARRRPGVGACGVSAGLSGGRKQSVVVVGVGWGQEGDGTYLG